MRFQFVFEAKDYEAAAAFYRDGLGFPVVYSWDRGADRGSFFGAASGIIEVVSDSMGLRGPNRLGVSIQVEDVEDVYRHVVNAGLTVERPPENRPWGTREFFLLHPDGHAVTFLEEPPESPRPESRP